jgi:hypothetical protein
MRFRSYFVILVYVVAANIPFWVACYLMGLMFKGPFSDEVLLVGILSVFVRRTVTVPLLLIAISIDILSSVSATYLLNVSDMLRSMGSLVAFAPSRVWELGVIAICMAMVCFVAWLASSERIAVRERRWVAGTLATFLVLCWAVDATTGHILVARHDRQLGTVCLTRFGSHFLVTSWLQRRTLEIPVPARANESVPSASTIMTRAEFVSQSSPSQGMAPNVVLILVESWGKALAVDLDTSLVRPYADESLAERYTVSRGTVPFHGPTVAGEARELCGSGMGFGLLSASRAELGECLPGRMKAMGYHSMAVHGFMGRMFDRSGWYERIGFDESWFRDELKDEGLPLCPGPFPGICDAAASVWIGDRLQRSSDSPQFVYWVTLNSHLPVPVPNRVKAPPSCSEISATGGDAALCSWYQLVFNVHRSVTELALRSMARPTVFLIVGDHAPPFSSPESRGRFSDQVVPYVLLVPKKDELRKELEATRSLAAVTRQSTGIRRSHGKSGKAAAFAAAGG